jgi:hypothetical protein
LANLLLLVGVAAWLFLDPKLEAIVRSGLTNEAQQLTWRSWCLLTLGGLATANFLLLVLCFLFGAPACRRFRSLLIIATLVGCWLGIGLNRSEFCWQGKRWRLRHQGAALNTVLDALLKHWPAEDGELAGLGPFMAYPVGDPQTLILLSPPRFSLRGTLISVVERTDTGAITFELSGAENGDWLEWHPPSSRPASHVGGLFERFELQRQTRLTDRWYLVRYVTHNGSRTGSVSD